MFFSVLEILKKVNIWKHVAYSAKARPVCSQQATMAINEIMAIHMGVEMGASVVCHGFVRTGVFNHKFTYHSIKQSELSLTLYS